ncbi:MAG TPA: hypothetical protein VFN67_15965 [Polyangiales bacterium]|jgi:hypothetical protein|nr:hypothetical protein [Polyangiales bacterium]
MIKQLSIGWLLAWSVACSDADKTPARDAAVRDAMSDAASTDSGPAVHADASLDLHDLLIVALIETERTLLARCPCLAEKAVYKSMRECVEHVSLGRSWVECANALDLTGMDDAEVRANLRCSIEELLQRTDCLMGSACTDEAVATCMSQSLDCPMLPLNVLSRVAVECDIGFSH